MTTAAAPKPATKPARLSPEKGNELVGLFLLLLGLLLAVSVVSYQPRDPSFFHRSFGGTQRAENLAGQVGAELAALSFSVLGLSALLVPVLLVGTAVRRLRRRERTRVMGRGFGGLLLLASVPAILQMVVTTVEWRGESLPAGGALGVLVAEALAARLNVAGTLLLLVGVVAIATALLVQSTLGDVIVAWRTRLREAIARFALWRARRSERRLKEDSRKRVVAKHLASRAEREARERENTVAGPPDPAVAETLEDDRLDLPLRTADRPASLAEARVRQVRVPALAGASAAASAAGRRLPSLALDDDDAVEVAGASAMTSRAVVRTPPPAKQSHLPFPTPAPGDATLPPLNLLQLEEDRSQVDENELVRLGEVIRKSCLEFGVEGSVEGISPGPVITVYEFQPAPGVKVSQIVNLQDDLALALKAESVRIDRLPGRSTLGIEVPNPKRTIIRLGSLLSRDAFRKAPSPLTMAIGTTIHGEPYYADLATMPHLLVAGATGAGKSVGLQSMITSILYKATRHDVQFIFIDPKRIELGVYADIPHLKCEVVLEPKKAANALRWAVAEMERRYRLLAEVHVRSIDFYNRAISDPEVQKRLSLRDDDAAASLADLKPLPYYVIVVDELADLMMVAAAEVETSIARLAQMARAVGIHLILATQRPSVDVLTGTIKANFPCRIAYATASRHDSRTILDQVGSERLLGKGDMLLMPPGSARITRLHGAYISEQETAALVRWMKKQGSPELDPSVLAAPESSRGEGSGEDNDDDLFDEAARLVVKERMGSASFLQRRLRVGFSRAARLIDLMEREGLLGPQQGSKPREVLVKPEYFAELDAVRQED